MLLTRAGYYNPLLAYGEEKAIRDAREAGANGFIMVDLPPEEAVSFRDKCQGAECADHPVLILDCLSILQLILRPPHRPLYVLESHQISHIHRRFFHLRRVQGICALSPHTRRSSTHRWALPDPPSRDP